MNIHTSCRWIHNGSSLQLRLRLSFFLFKDDKNEKKQNDHKNWKNERTEKSKVVGNECRRKKNEMKKIVRKVKKMFGKKYYYYNSCKCFSFYFWNFFVSFFSFSHSASCLLFCRCMYVCVLFGSCLWHHIWLSPVTLKWFFSLSIILCACCVYIEIVMCASKFPCAYLQQQRKRTLKKTKKKFSFLFEFIIENIVFNNVNCCRRFLPIYRDVLCCRGVFDNFFFLHSLFFFRFLKKIIMKIFSRLIKKEF